VPQAFEELVIKCLSKDPSERFQSMEVLLDAATRVQEASGWSTAPPLTSSASWGLRVRRLIRRVSIRRTITISGRALVRLVLGSAMVIGLFLFGVCAWIIVTNQPASHPTGRYEVELPEGRTCTLVISDELAGQSGSYTNCGGHPGELCEGSVIDGFNFDVECDAGTAFQLEDNGWGYMKGKVNLEAGTFPIKARLVEDTLQPQSSRWTGWLRDNSPAFKSKAVMTMDKAARLTKPGSAHGALAPRGARLNL
jgi:hypothetical protein